MDGRRDLGGLNFIDLRDRYGITQVVFRPETVSEDVMKTAAKLGYEYVRETIQNGAPPAVIEAALDILRSDVMGEEFKTSLRKRSQIFGRVFQSIQTFKTWPEPQLRYGDYISVCRV